MTVDDFMKLIVDVLSDFSNENPRLKIAPKAGACERAICFRLGLHLARRAKGFVVDSEYNVDLTAKGHKTLPRTGRTGRVFPDLILHKRTSGTDQNFAVIEVKFKSAGKKAITEAEKRVERFRRYYGYKVGAVIVIPRRWDEFTSECIKLLKVRG